MKRTEIVFAVVRCGAQICLARRSQAVATSRGLWSVVTGYVEPNVQPLTQAWTEVLEELGLGSPGLKLTHQLAPVPLTSQASGKQFLVYPFLFDCDATDHVVLNWEHVDVRWVDPSRLADPDCVSWQLPLVQALLQQDG